MSGVTPIIDTLLHQVLGRREMPVERPLPDTLILPAQPGSAAAKAYSDSRLDPRALVPARSAGASASKSAAPDAGTAGADPPTEAPTRTATPVRFSGAARTIAEVLARFPAPPSALRVAAPLLAAGPTIDAAKLAALLRASIETSGLFYEAHLKRWRSGSLPLARLLVEPQMRATAATTLPTLRGRHTAQPRAATNATLPTLEPPMPSAPPAGLDGVLRHQLELLVAPVLHWEGAPWSGVFMTLTLQPPSDRPDAEPQPDAGDPRRADDEAPWRSRLVLRLARLGKVEVGLRLDAHRVALDLVGSPATAARMRAGSAGLHTRLATLGFGEVGVHVRADAVGAGKPRA
ncbi:MAG TPA: flagellar hook-length control protein FliK [Rhodanobacteraceae bacterium]|nr:flagellar hook-length control protein FliK [Rhodanobacteraceae bacterium]